MSISIGDKALKECYIGSNKVKEIYVGSDKVWPSWTLLYEADVNSGGARGTTTLATIPNYIHKTTKIKVVVTYIRGTWTNGVISPGSGKQTISFGTPPNTPMIDLNADNPIHSIQYTTGNTTYFLGIDKYASGSNEYGDSTWGINQQGQLTKNTSSSVSWVLSDPVHLQVYYQ